MSARLRFRAAASLAVLLLSLLACLGGAAPKTQDRVQVRPGAASFPLRRIAFLPVVSLDYGAGRAVEEQWLLHFIDDGHDWVPPEISAKFMSSLSPRKPDSVLTALRAQVFKQGLPDSLRVPVVARALHSQALLSVRVDRWQRVVESDRRITTAYVELTATLVDSTGRTLWQVAGEERQSAKYGVPQMIRGSGDIGARSAREARSDNFLLGVKSSGDVGARLGGGGTDLPPDFLMALTAILERWRAAYPFAHSAQSGVARAP